LNSSFSFIGIPLPLVNRLDQLRIAFIASPIANEAVHGRSNTNLLFGSY
jgi:hypothetical protein